MSIDVLESKGKRRCKGQPGFRMHIMKSKKVHQLASRFCIVTQLHKYVEQSGEKTEPLFPFLTVNSQHRQTAENRFNNILRLSGKKSLTTHCTRLNTLLRIRYTFVFLLMAFGLNQLDRR